MNKIYISVIVLVFFINIQCCPKHGDLDLSNFKMVDSVIRDLIKKYPDIPYSIETNVNIDSVDLNHIYSLKKSIYDSDLHLSIEMRYFSRCEDCYKYIILLVTDNKNCIFAIPFTDNIYYWKSNKKKLMGNVNKNDNYVNKLSFEREMNNMIAYFYKKKKNTIKHSLLPVKISILINDIMSGLLNYELLTIKDTSKIRNTLHDSKLESRISNEVAIKVKNNINTVINELKSHDYSYRYYLVNNMIYKFKLNDSLDRKLKLEVLNKELIYESIW